MYFIKSLIFLHKKKTEMEKVKYTTEKALQAIKEHGVGVNTTENWRKAGYIPIKYVSTKVGYTINGKSLFHLRSERYTQAEFVLAFNNRFGLEITQTHLSNWESGKNKPNKLYQRYLDTFFTGGN